MGRSGRNSNELYFWCVWNVTISHGNERLVRRQELPQKEIPLLEQGGGLDTVSFSTNKSEKFADVRAELDQNIPDRTTTIEEKEKAISYIDTCPTT